MIQPYETRSARALRAALTANGEIGSAIGLLAMAVSIPLMIDPHMFGTAPLVSLGEQWQSVFDFIAGVFFVKGVVQLVAVLGDRRTVRLWSCYIAAIIWAMGVLAFAQIRFLGAVSLCAAMVVTNVLAAVRGRLKGQEWQRLNCDRASYCDRRKASEGHE